MRTTEFQIQLTCHYYGPNANAGLRHKRLKVWLTRNLGLPCLDPNLFILMNWESLS